jgi:hypothetical protein
MNDILEEFKQKTLNDIELEKYVIQLEQGKIPKRFPYQHPKIWRHSIHHYKLKDKIRELGMFALVDKTWTKLLADWIGNRFCLEVMAGAGWLAKALYEYNVDIIATDNKSWSNLHSKIKLYSFNVKRMSAIDAIQKYNNAEILIMSWPPYDEPDAYDAMVEWGKDRFIVYIGESEGGCTADDNFHKHFYIYNEINIPMPQWDGIHDCVFIGKYIGE